MYSFGRRSKKHLNTCHPDIVKIFNYAINFVDISIIEGIRSKETQEEYVRTGKSKTMNSRHLKQEDGYSHAVDAALYPIDWSDRDRFVFLAGIIIGISNILYEKGEISHKIRSGVDWDSDANIKEHSFFDGPHFEIYKP